MKNIRPYLLPVLFILFTFSLSSCEAIGDIFQAGMWTAVIVIVIVVLIVIWIFRKITGR
ncbi:hypothetical protein [Pontibacter chitinilyticus]|uniref:hypothetical protein n=1 Tax=Pontibacter chitinilyticus TaxID=2674989 RepID=UPI00321AC6A0